jgi:stage II sporulation protein E
MLIGEVAATAIRGASPLYFVTAVLEAALSGLLALLFFEGIRAVKYGGGRYIFGFALMLGCIAAGMSDINVIGIPLVIAATALIIPLLSDRCTTEGSECAYIRKCVCGRLKSFALSLERLSESMAAVTEHIDYGTDITGLERALKKSRAMLCEELNFVSEQLRRLETEFATELVPAGEDAQAVAERLKADGIRCDNVIVYRHGERYEVNVVKRVGGNCGSCRARTALSVSKALGVNMTVGTGLCHREGDECVLRLYEEHPYKISVYAAAKKRDGSLVSGDSHTFMELKYGTYMLALSDGMGSGGRAREESAASVELFEDFMEAGFERECALEQINSLLLLRAGGEDIFATMDICNVDLYEGRAEFVKIGGMPSFIAGKNGVKIVGGGGLPVGIVDKTEAESMEVGLESGDVIVMVTDGVTEAAPCAIGKENWLARIIDQYASLQPEALCEKILTQARLARGGAVADDMTVIAAKVRRI